MAFRNSRSSDGFKNRAVFASVFITLILMGYQNCGQVQKTQTIKGNRKITPLESLSDVTQFSLIEQEVLKRDPNANPRDPKLNGQPIEWTIDLTKNQIFKRYYDVPQEDPAGNIITCDLSGDLSETSPWLNWVQTLQTLMANSQVCHFEIIQPEGTICPAVIEAEKHSEVKNFKLGYRSSPCVDYHDICQAQLDLYIITLRDFINEYSTCESHQ